jgi:hypothetical protein
MYDLENWRSYYVQMGRPATLSTEGAAI